MLDPAQGKLGRRDARLLIEVAAIVLGPVVGGRRS
jgi:hypothetical protein